VGHPMAVRVAWVSAVALVLVGVAVGAAAQEAFFEFNVKPDGQRTVMRRELGPHLACEFVYAATGGTNEDWLMTIVGTGPGDLACTIERPDRASYLFFSTFEAALSVDLRLASVAVENSKGERLLHQNDWDAVDARRIKSLPRFSGALHRIELVAAAAV
jgi:hypothetical protein